MHRKPDVIRALVIVFAVGLLVSGITSFASGDGDMPVLSNTAVSSLLAPAEGLETGYSSRY